MKHTIELARSQVNAIIECDLNCGQEDADGHQQQQQQQQQQQRQQNNAADQEQSSCASSSRTPRSLKTLSRVHDMRRISSKAFGECIELEAH